MVLKGVKLMTLLYMFMEVYKCVKNTNSQYLNEMSTLKKCTYDLWDHSFLERPATRLINYGLKSIKILVTKYGIFFQHHVKCGHLIQSKTWSKLGLNQPANEVFAVCLHLDFPIISMNNNLTNHNCLFWLSWCCGFTWSTVLITDGWHPRNTSS